MTAFDYAYPYEALIQRYKGARRHVMANALAQSLAQAVQTVEAIRANESFGIAGPGTGRPLIDAVVPIPASRASLRQRGFNPAGELARALSGRLALRLLRGVLRRRHESGARQASQAEPTTSNARAVTARQPPRAGAVAAKLASSAAAKAASAPMPYTPT